MKCTYIKKSIVHVYSRNENWKEINTCSVLLLDIVIIQKVRIFQIDKFSITIIIIIVHVKHLLFSEAIDFTRCDKI